MTLTANATRTNVLIHTAVTRKLLDWIDDEKPHDVLEVGTATGFLSAEMTSRGCRVTGIEQDEKMAEVASSHCDRMIVGDVETLDFSELGQFDAVILGDVVEHLRQPQEFLQKMVKVLKPGGKVLMSLPNVANIWMRLNLLFGRFNYSRVGILDESHLRFFTLQSSQKMAHDCGSGSLEYRSHSDSSTSYLAIDE